MKTIWRMATAVVLVLAASLAGPATVCRGTAEDSADLAAFFMDAMPDGSTGREPGQLSVPHAAPFPRKASETHEGGPRAWASQLPDLRHVAKRAGLFLLGMCTVCGITMWIGGRRKHQMQRSKDASFGVSGSLAVGPGIGIKVVQIGRQKIVIGYDRTGMRDMVVLPEPFTSMLEEQDVDPRALNVPRDSYRPALAQVLSNPKDSGWELNHTIPPR